MDLCHQSCWSGWLVLVRLSILRSECFHTTHCMQFFQPNSFMPAIFKGSVDLTLSYHFQWPWLWWKRGGGGGGSQGQHKAKPVGFIFLHTLNWSGSDLIVVLKQLKLNILLLLLKEICSVMGSNCCFTECVKENLDIGLYSDVYAPIWLKSDMVKDELDTQV